jgi:hypothetical protein
MATRHSCARLELDISLRVLMIRARIPGKTRLAQEAFLLRYKLDFK